MDLTRYGFGPEQLFYQQPSPLESRTQQAPPIVPAQPAQPAPIVDSLFRDWNADPTPMAETMAHPNPSIGAAIKSAATGLGLMSPMGLAMGLMSLAASDALGMKPSLSRTDVAREALARATGRSPYADIDEIQSEPTAIGNKPPSSLDVQSIFSGGSPESAQMGDVTSDHDNGMGAGFGYAQGGLINDYKCGGIVQLFAEGGRVHPDTGRPMLANRDGSVSTEESITVTDSRLNGGLPTNIPSIWGGRRLNEEQAISTAAKSGQNFKSYDSIAAAVQAARERSDHLGRNFARGGVVELFGGGKVAVGPGGGMDDLIPTTIDGGRLANLSDGEFVIPADVVSAVGDGSTNAGATRLYDLVKAIRQQKTGTERQARPVQFEQILRQVMR